MNDKLEYYVLPFISTLFLWIIAMSMMVALEICGLIDEGIIYNALLIITTIIILSTKVRITKFILSNKNWIKYVFSSCVFIIILILLIPRVEKYQIISIFLKLAIEIEIISLLCYRVYDELNVLRKNFKLVDFQSEIYYLSRPGSNEYVPLEYHLVTFVSLLLVIITSLFLEITFWDYMNMIVKLLLIISILVPFYFVIDTIKKWDENNIATVSDADYILIALAYIVASLILFLVSPIALTIVNRILFWIVTLAIYIIVYFIIRIVFKKNLPVIDKYKDIESSDKSNNVLINIKESEFEQMYKKMDKKDKHPKARLLITSQGAIEELKSTFFEKQKIIVIENIENDDIISQVFYSTCSAFDPMNVYINLVNLIYEKKLWKQIIAYLAASMVVINVIRQTIGLESINPNMYIFLLVTTIIIIIWFLPYLLLGEKDGTTNFQNLYLHHIVIASSTSNPVVIGISGSITNCQYLSIKQLVDRIKKSGNNVLCIEEKKDKEKELRVSKVNEEFSKGNREEEDNTELIMATYDEIKNYKHEDKVRFTCIARKYGIILEPNSIEVDRNDKYADKLQKEWKKIKYDTNIKWITIDAYSEVVYALGEIKNISDQYFEELCEEYSNGIKNDTKNYGFSTFLKNKVKGQAIGDIIE